MNISKRIIFLLRIALGWIFFYAGITKVLDPTWSAAGLLNNAQTFPTFYHWLASPDILVAINFVNKWALLVLGVSLILGLFVRLSSSMGIALMALYYLPQLHFPYVGKNYLLIDEHVIFILGLAILIQSSAGRVWGIDNWCARLPLCKKYPKIRALLG